MRITTLIATLALNSLCLADTWTVDLNGGADFTTIQAAIDAASDGDTIQVVPSGVYAVMGDTVADLGSKALTLESADPEFRVIIHGIDASRGFVCQPAPGKTQIVRRFLFEDCRAATPGAGIRAIGNVEIDECSFSKCVVSADGGAGGGLYVEGSAVVTDSGFMECYSNRGGGLALAANSTLQLSSTIFGGNWGNQAHGGALWIGEGSVVNASDLWFDGNMGDLGAAIYLANNSSFVGGTNEDIKFNMNWAWCDGGAVYADSGSTLTLDASFSQNEADGNGGSIRLWNAHATIKAHIWNSRARNMGGFISASHSTLVLHDCLFQASNAPWGGALALQSGATTVTNSSFSNCTAENFGGGIWNDNSLLLVDGCSFGDNTAFGGSVIRSANDNDAAHTTFKNSVACNNGNPIIQGLWTDGGGNDLFGCGGQQGSPAPSPWGDLNNDHSLDGADMGVLLAQWGSADTGDLNHDGAVDGADFGILLANWGN